jgi:glycosyltransferase involved in cell wall biosynthesis
MITASHSYANWFKENYEFERPTVVQNFPLKIVNPQDYTVTNNPKIILYQGVINPSRGLDKMIPAMKSIEAELWIAGEGPKKAQFESLTKSLGLEYKIKFLGKLLPTDLRNITKKADVGLSIEENSGLSYYYSMPNKISDYIQARVPVVVSDFPEMRKVVDNLNAGQKITHYSELPEKINKVLQKGKLFYKDNLDKAASELCWENEEPRLLALFKKVSKENF